MMRSRPARLTLCTLALIALCGTVLYSTITQSQVDSRHSAFLLFERTARDASDALQDVQAGQQAYVTPGQDSREWMNKVSSYLKTIAGAIEALKPSAVSPATKASLQDASAATASVAAIDKRLRTQVGAGEVHQASDIIFSEANDTIASARADVASAIESERQSAEAYADQRYRMQRFVLVSTVLIAGLAIVLVGLVPAGFADRIFGGAEELSPELAEPRAGLDLAAAAALLDARTEQPYSAASIPTELLSSISDLCTGFGRASNADALRPLLEESADVIGARGLIVWLGDLQGGDLRPVLAHGYSDATLARLSRVPRHADNAAAQAYRTGDVQVVPSRAGGSLGAVVAPLLSTDGCIGALTAEIRERGDESAEETRALAVIIASQLASALAAAASASAATTATLEEAEPNAAAG